MGRTTLKDYTGCVCVCLRKKSNREIAKQRTMLWTTRSKARARKQKDIPREGHPLGSTTVQQFSLYTLVVTCCSWLLHHSTHTTRRSTADSFRNWTPPPGSSCSPLTRLQGLQAITSKANCTAVSMLVGGLSTTILLQSDQPS
jgi:hypothetical protein